MRAEFALDCCGHRWLDCLGVGDENGILAAKANNAGIEVVEGCTLVMLRTGQF